MLKELFLSIFENYLEDKTAFFRASKPRRIENYYSAEVLREKLPKQIFGLANLTKRFIVRGSVGVGNMSEISHLCVFDKDITTSAQQGYYIVYLFDSNMTKVYLSLNQGWTQYRNNYGTKEGGRRILENATIARKFLRTIGDFDFSSISLNASGGLGKGYENGNICSKMYEKNNFPDDNIIIDDLRNLMAAYTELKGWVGGSILDIPSSSGEENFQSEVQKYIPKEYPQGPRLKKEIRFLSKTSIYPRDAGISAAALYNANYQCEHDPEHTTFTSPKSGKQFMEAHHLIPLEFHKEFQNSLDVLDNIVCLCPICHRAFHNSDPTYKDELIQKFYYLRADKLTQRGIGVTRSRLLSFYKRLDNLEDV